jgi:hypothetical protein
MPVRSTVWMAGEPQAVCRLAGMKPGFSSLVLAALVALPSCASAPVNPSEGPGKFEGLYVQGFEVSAFSPCGADAKSTSRYWLTPNAEFSNRYNALATTRGSNAFGPSVFVRFSGTLSSAGRYGHLGSYSHEITVTALSEMAVRESCR